MVVQSRVCRRRESHARDQFKQFPTHTKNTVLFAPVLQADNQWQRFLRHDGLIIPQRAKILLVDRGADIACFRLARFGGAGRLCSADLQPLIHNLTCIDDLFFFGERSPRR